MKPSGEIAGIKYFLDKSDFKFGLKTETITETIERKVLKKAGSQPKVKRSILLGDKVTKAGKKAKYKTVKEKRKSTIVKRDPDTLSLSIIVYEQGGGEDLRVTAHNFRQRLLREDGFNFTHPHLGSQWGMIRSSVNLSMVQGEGISVPYFTSSFDIIIQYDPQLEYDNREVNKEVMKLTVERSMRSTEENNRLFNKKENPFYEMNKEQLNDTDLYKPPNYKESLIQDVDRQDSWYASFVNACVQIQEKCNDVVLTIASLKPNLKRPFFLIENVGKGFKSILTEVRDVFGIIDEPISTYIDNMLNAFKPPYFRSLDDSQTSFDLKDKDLEVGGLIPFTMACITSYEYLLKCDVVKEDDLRRINDTIQVCNALNTKYLIDPNLFFNFNNFAILFNRIVETDFFGTGNDKYVYFDNEPIMPKMYEETKDHTVIYELNKYNENIRNYFNHKGWLYIPVR